MDVDHSALDEIGRPIIHKCPKTEQKIDFRLGSAIDTLGETISQSDRLKLRSTKIDNRLMISDKLIAEGKSGQFDFAFIDADKENYTNYYDKCMQLLRPGGVILVDNVSKF